MTIGRFLEAIWRDGLYALRMMRKTPGFSAAVVLTLALGIGANSAVFSAVNALLLRPLPLRDPSGLVFIIGVSPARPGAGFPFSLQMSEAIRDRGRSFSAFTAFCRETLTLTGAGDPEQLRTALVSPNFFEVLQSQPMIGRGFEPGEGEPGGKAVVLISHRLWQQRFASDLAVPGKPITLGQEVYTIIGVMPPEYPFPDSDIDVWGTNLTNFTLFRPEQIRSGAGYLMGIARLKPGAAPAQAETELAVLQQQDQQSHAPGPDADQRTRLEVRPLQESYVEGIRPTLLVLTGVVGVVLLIACANVAGLMLARATGRAREIVLRASLGASRGQLIQQLLLESLLLSAAGAVLAVLFARGGITMLEHSSLYLPGFRAVRLDLGVLAFTFATSLATGIGFGLMPALEVSQPDLNGVLRDSSWGNTGGPRRHRLRSLLVVGQMALSVVLLIGAGLLMASFRRLQSVQPGFESTHALTMSLTLPRAKYPDDARRSQFVRHVVERLAALPGVRSATASLALPLSTAALTQILAEGQAVVPIAERPSAEWNSITPGYFATMGIPVRRGRDFSPEDDQSAPKRVIISESLARRWWPNEDPVGRHLTYARSEAAAEVVGVVGDVKTHGLEADSGVVFYTPYSQFAWPSVSFTIRAAGDPRQLSRAARSELLAADRDLPVTGPQTLDELLDTSLSERRQTMYWIAGFAGLALLLAMVGLYGVVAYFMAQRTVEIAIRQALGAQLTDILAMVLGQGLRMSLAGIGAGVIAAGALTRLLSKMLYQVSPADPLVFLGVSVLVLMIALAASYFPARRATRVDPMAALRIG